jgi:hypothetical protein
MNVSELQWNHTEQQVAKAAFDRAYQREIERLIELVQRQAGAISAIDDVWQLHDFLSAKRHEIDGKYDYQYPALIFVFADLVKDGLLHLDELSGLDASKLTKIAALTRF